ncbi:MAG: hypothetical protein ACRC1N_16960, partial [Aeromonas sobria]
MMQLLLVRPLSKDYSSPCRITTEMTSFFIKKGALMDFMTTIYVINQQLTHLRKSCALPQLSLAKHGEGT